MYIQKTSELFTCFNTLDENATRRFSYLLNEFVYFQKRSFVFIFKSVISKHPFKSSESGKNVKKSLTKPMLNLKHKNVEMERSSQYVLFQFAVPRKTQTYQNHSQQGPGFKASSWVRFHISSLLKGNFA